MTVDYLNPEIAAHLPQVSIPLVIANDQNLNGYGFLVNTPDEIDIEIVRWPKQGWREVDCDSGNEGGTTEGIFISGWKGDILYGSNEAVGGKYVLGYNCDPTEAKPDNVDDPIQILLWHANYHPDGGQLFYPIDRRPFIIPLALPGDDVLPNNFVAFVFDGSVGCYIHPNVWHDGVFTTMGTQKFFDRQGRVHARVSVNFPKEFGCLLHIDLEEIRALASR